MASAVLLIDDNAIQAATRQAILQRAGYLVVAVLNPRRALEQFENAAFPMEIGLVVTDHIMPEMSGAAFVHELRKSHPKMPVLVISGLDEAEQEYAGLDVHFRLKPVPPSILLSSVQEMLISKPAED